MFPSVIWNRSVGIAEKQWLNMNYIYEHCPPELLASLIKKEQTACIKQTVTIVKDFFNLKNMRKTVIIYLFIFWCMRVTITILIYQ